MDAPGVSPDSSERTGASSVRLDHPPWRILVREVNWLGDLVLSLPALAAVRRAFPKSHLTVQVKQELEGFFDGLDWIDEVMPYSIRRGVAGLLDRRAIVSRIRLGLFDLAILFPNSFESALWVTLASVPQRAGYSTDLRGMMLTHARTPPTGALEGHQSEYWLAMLRATLGLDGPDEQPALTPSEEHRASMRAWLERHRRRAGRPLVALAPAAAFGPAKEWPQE